MPHFPVRGRDVVELASGARAAPAAPAELAPRAAEIWNELYSAPVAELWTSSDAGLVRRLVVLRERLESDASAPAALYSAALRLEQHLGLTPAARVALGVVLAEDEPSRRPTRNGARMSARQRDRLLRG